MSDLKNLKNFRGNILDRQFPVQFDPETGQYSYNYVEKTPELDALLKKLKFFRKSSKSLAEIEADLAAYLKSQVSAPPPVKGEITQAIEAEAAKGKIAENILQKGFERSEAGITNTDEQRAVIGEALNEQRKLLRPKKVDYAKQQQNAIYEKYNKRLAEGRPVDIDPDTKRAKLTPGNQSEYDKFQKIVDAADYLNSLDAKVKQGVKLTPGEITKQTNETRKINNFRLPDTPSNANVSKTINDKASYNAARATITQLKNKKNLTLNERNKLTEAIISQQTYLDAHPNVERRVSEQETLQLVELARRKIQEFNTKPQPLSPEDGARKATLQRFVTSYNTYKAAMNPLANKESANLQVTGSKNIFEEPTTYEPIKKNNTGLKSLPEQGSTPQRELSNAAFQARRAKAQKVLNFFKGATAPAAPSSEQTTLRNNAQRIINSFATINSGTAKPNEKNAARNTIKKSNFLNKARKLSIPTEGGKRRTRKLRRSGRKTYRRRH